MNIFDAVWIIVVVIGFLLGYKKGFFGSITKPIKIVASICLTVIVASPVINVWTRSFFVGKVETWINETLSEVGTATIEELPSVLQFSVELLQIDVEGLETVEEMVSAMAAPIGNFIAVIVTYVALFIVFMILLTILVSLLDIAFNKGFLGKVNRFMGLLLGGVIAAVIACILANIIGSFAPGLVGGPVSQFFKNFNPFSLVLRI